ncbi:MAG: hypothetical protein N2663_05600 [Chlorobi bacterium]|nr:hypothetical protein [Chlorobiota bacterium]
MRVLGIVLCCVVLLGADGLARQPDSAKVRVKKKATAVAPAAKQTAQPTVDSSDPRVGTTPKGQVVYRGKKGAYYVLTPSGRKRYIKEANIIFDNGK